MDLPHIVKSLQSGTRASRTTALAALEQFDRPLTEKEVAALKAFQADVRSQLDAGLKVPDTPPEIQQLTRRPTALLHPLMVGQCVLAASKLSHLHVNEQKQLQRHILPLALLRHPLQVKEAAALLNATAQLPLQQSAASRTCAASVLRCLSLILFEAQRKVPGTASNGPVVGVVQAAESAAWGKVCSSFAISRVKPAPPLELEAMKAIAPKVKDISLAETQKLWWSLLGQLLHVQAQAFQEEKKHNAVSGTKEPHLNHNLLSNCQSRHGSRSTRLPFVAAREVRQMAQLAQRCHDADPEASVLARASLTKPEHLLALATLNPCPHSPYTTASPKQMQPRDAAPFSLSPATLLSTIRNSPGLVRSFFGSSNAYGAAAGSSALCVEGTGHDNALEPVVEMLETCLYNLGLTTTSSESFLDYLAVLLSVRGVSAPAPSSDAVDSTRCLRALFQKKGGTDLIESLLSPFVNNARALSAALARQVSPLYTQLTVQWLSPPNEPEWAKEVADALLVSTSAFLANRCRSPAEKFVVTHLVVALSAPLLPPSKSADVLAARNAEGSQQDALCRFLQRELASPSADAVALALRLLPAWGFQTIRGTVVQEGFQAALRNAKKDEAVRRAVLLYTPVVQPQPLAQELTAMVVAELADGLLSECDEIEVSRPDAFLALYFYYASDEAAASSTSIASKRLSLLSSAEVLASLLHVSSSASTGNNSSSSTASPTTSAGSFTRIEVEGGALHEVAHRVLHLALALSQAGHHTTLVQLLTHPSHWLQQELYRYLEQQVVNGANGAALVQAVWDTLVSEVFGLGAPPRRQRSDGTAEGEALFASGVSLATAPHRVLPPLILSPFATDAVVLVGRLMLSVLPTASNTKRRSAEALVPAAAVPTFLATLLCCLGHDSVQGEDAFFFSLFHFMKGRPRGALPPVQVAPLTHLLGELYQDVLVEQPMPVLQQLLAQLTDTSAPEYVVTAAARGTALLLSELSQASRRVHSRDIASPVGGTAAEFGCGAEESSGEQHTSITPTAAGLVAEAYGQLFQRVRHALAALRGMSRRDLAIASGSRELLLEFMDEELRERHLLKDYPDRPPKGMSADDFEALKKKDAIALVKGREQLEAEVLRARAPVMQATRAFLGPFLTVRLLGVTPAVDLAGVALFYPYFSRLLCGEDEADVVTALLTGVDVKRKAKKDDEENAASVHPLLSHLYMDSIRGVLHPTPLGPYAEVLTDVVVRLSNQKFLERADVSQISALALALRRSITQMLPAPLFVVLTGFCRVAFKAGREAAAATSSIPIATQHQLLGMLLQSVGQPHLPQPTSAMELFALILRNFPSLYKSVLQGVQSLMPLIPAKHLRTIEAGLFGSEDGVRDVVAASFARFTHFHTSRRALVLAMVFTTDHNSSNVILKGVQDILDDERYHFALQSSDWEHLLYFMSGYGHRKANALLILETMKKIFVMPEMDEAKQLECVQQLCAIGGLASVVGLRGLSSTLHPKPGVAAIEYLCSMTETTNQMEALLREVLEAGRVVLNDLPLETLRAIAPTLQNRLEKPPKEATAAHKEQYMATATVWLTILSCRLQEVELLRRIIEQQSRTLNNSQSMMVHRCVCESMKEVTKNAEVRKMAELDEFMEKCVKQAIQSGSYVKKKAHAWGLAGVISGLGLPSLRRYKIIEIIQKAATEKQTEKTGAMIIVEVLCDVLDHRFEPYALALCEILLAGVADQDQHVSACADDAVQVMMRKTFSGIGLRQLIPHLILILSSDQAKKRVAPLNFIGHVASCSPQQLAATLPVVMRHIMPCLFEVNSIVSTAAYNALRRVAGVVSNVEIQEQVEKILNAMRSPSTETEGALDALLYTRFVNVVDPASLALVIPVISRGLSGQMKNTRSKAAQIMATMVTLVRDPKSLVPYSDELILALENAAQDPEPEARTTSAKAIAALCCAISHDMVRRVAQWCFDVLQKPSSGTIEKAGGGQVFVELVNQDGMTLMEEYYEVLEKGMTDERPGVREGFLYIMVYAPSTFEQSYFQSFLPAAFPWVLNGLSHYSDRVREVALTAGDSIISLYGTRNLSLVLGPLLEGVYSEITPLRHSSLILASKLLLHLAAHIRKKTRLQLALQDRQQQLLEGKGPRAGLDDDDEEPDLNEDGEEVGGVLTVEAARDVEKRGVSLLSTMEEMLGTDSFVRLFAAIFCGTHEHTLEVRTDCNLAWQACVASIRGAVRKIFDALVVLLIQLASSSNPDCVDAAVKTIEFTSRIQETIEMFIETFCARYKEGDVEEHSESNEDEDEEEEEPEEKRLNPEEIRRKRGCLVCLSAVTALADSKKLISMGGQLVGCILPGMQHDDDEVQAAARDLFAKVTKAVGPRLIEDAVEAQLQTSVRGVVEVVKVRPLLALQIIFRYFKSKSSFTDHDLELLNEIIEVEEAAEDLFTSEYVAAMMKVLLTCLQQGMEDASDVLQGLVEYVDLEQRDEILNWIQKAAQVPTTRRAAVLAMEAYGLGTDVDDVESLHLVLQAVISALSDEDTATKLDAVRILPRLISHLEEKIISTLDSEEARDMTVSKRTSGRYLSQYLDAVHTSLAATARSFLQGGVETHFDVLGEGEPRLFDALMLLYQRGLDYGTPEQKVEAVECIQDLMEFAPLAVSANAANTVAGRCSKALFTRNEGSVVLALVRLCLQLLQFPANGKEKMVEGTMALALFNATLCDSGEARVVALQVVIQLLRRSERYAELILGNVMTKKAAVDTPLFKTVLCRFVSVILRYSHFTKAYLQIPKLMALVRPIWEDGATPAQACAGGVAVGALCKSASITEEQLRELKEHVLRMLSTPGSASLAGYAAAYSLIIAAGERTDTNFLHVSAEALASAAKFGATNKFSTLWILRAAAAVASTQCIPLEKFQAANYLPLLRRLLPTDETMMSAAQFFYDQVTAAYPSTAALFEDCHRGYSAVCADGYDADLDDELIADEMQ